MPTNNRENPHERAHRGLRTVAPCPAGFRMTPEWHSARAWLLRWLDDPYLAQHHESLAKLIEHRRRRGC
jgi:hypothetical protein